MADKNWRSMDWFLIQRLEEVSSWLWIIWRGVESATLGIFQLALIVIPLMVVIQVMKERQWLKLVSQLDDRL